MTKRYTKKVNRYNKKVNIKTKKVRKYNRKIRTRKNQKGGMQTVKKSIQKKIDNYKEKKFKKEIEKDLEILTSFSKPKTKEEKEKLSRYVLSINEEDKIKAYIPFKILIYIIITRISEFKPGILKTLYTKLFKKYLKKYINNEESIISKIGQRTVHKGGNTVRKSCPYSQRTKKDKRLDKFLDKELVLLKKFNKPSDADEKERLSIYILTKNSNNKDKYYEFKKKLKLIMSKISKFQILMLYNFYKKRLEEILVSYINEPSLKVLFEQLDTCNSSISK